MVKFTESEIRIWSDEIGISNQLLAELDLNIVSILREISENAKFNGKLYVKGGTAINKLHLQEMSRLSVDIDLNHIGSKKDVLQERASLAKDLIAELKLPKHSYETRIKRTYDRTAVLADYSSLSRSTQRIKIEISHIERFPILPPVKKKMKIPEGETNVVTYTLEELLSTKIRAFYDRLKGRDIYDIWAAIRGATVDKNSLRKMFLYYFYRDRKEFRPNAFFSHLENAMEKRAIEDDVSGYISSNIDFKLEKETRSVIEWLHNLGELDAKDSDFLMLARSLLGKEDVPKGKRRRISSIAFPLVDLFGGEAHLSSQAAAITTEDIRLFSAKIARKRGNR